MCTDEKDLTEAGWLGTMKEGAGGPRGGGSRKTRRADGPQAASLNDFILRLHTFAREWEELSREADVAGSSLLSGMLNELAEVLKHEYDVRHG